MGEYRYMHVVVILNLIKLCEVYSVMYIYNYLIYIQHVWKTIQVTVTVTSLERNDLILSYLFRAKCLWSRQVLPIIVS